jgi:hypothetical protein
VFVCIILHYSLGASSCSSLQALREQLRTLSELLWAVVTALERQRGVLMCGEQWGMGEQHNGNRKLDWGAPSSQEFAHERRHHVSEACCPGVTTAPSADFRVLTPARALFGLVRMSHYVLSAIPPSTSTTSRRSRRDCFCAWRQLTGQKMLMVLAARPKA